METDCKRIFAFTQPREEKDSSLFNYLRLSVVPFLLRAKLTERLAGANGKGYGGKVNRERDKRISTTINHISR